MYEIPIKWVFRGDRNRGVLFRRRGQYLMGMLERQMSFNDLQQCMLRRFVEPDVLIECDKRFGLRTVTITVAPGAGEVRKVLHECFANTTVALAYVLDVVGVVDIGQVAEYVEEPICKTCIGVNAYPENYYCTMGIRYTVAVCDGKGDYLLFNVKAPSTDYTPRCPGEQVLVMQNRTNNLPETVLSVANADPYNQSQPFTQTLSGFQGESISILPFPVNMPRIYEVTT